MKTKKYYNAQKYEPHNPKADLFGYVHPEATLLDKIISFIERLVN